MTQEQIDDLNADQKRTDRHPLTCPGIGPGCPKAALSKDNSTDDGVLIATAEGWVCPCGEYKQKYNPHPYLNFLKDDTKEVLKMTAAEFNEKYKAYIPEGYKGLEFDIPEVTTYLDSIMSDGLVHIPGFKIHQIKLKFGVPRFYFESDFSLSMETEIQRTVELEINKLIKKE